MQRRKDRKEIYKFCVLRISAMNKDNLNQGNSGTAISLKIQRVTYHFQLNS